MLRRRAHELHLRVLLLLLLFPFLSLLMPTVARGTEEDGLPPIERDDLRVGYPARAEPFFVACVINNE